MKLFSQKFCILAVAGFAMLVSQNAYAVSAAVQQVTGEVLVAKAADPDTWATITGDTELASGDSVKTRTGTCSIVYTDQAAFAVEPNTLLTIEERTDAEDIKLLLGKIKGKVDHQNATQPFVVTTPAAVATVRGTEVDFSFNDEGELTVDLHNGNIQVVNDAAEMNVDLGGKKSISIKYDKEANTIHVKNSCDSDGQVTFNVLGSAYATSPCDEKEVNLSTAEEGTQIPQDKKEDEEQPENPDDLREPSTEFNA